MLTRFLHGLVFGTGFAIAFVAVSIIGVTYLLPKTFEAAQKEPTFQNPRTADLAQPEPSLAPEASRDFSFFKDSESRMKIPDNGGILSMSPTSTPADAERPNTYQLWLTEFELWQIRTSGDKAEIEKLPYPDGASVETLGSLMYRNLGTAGRQSTMTVSGTDIYRLKSSGKSSRDASLNGQLKITVEGVVFFLPNPYET